MSVNDRILWEVQWHPASGAGIRRLVISWRSARRVMLALGVAGLVVVAGWSLAGLDGLLAGFPVDSARRENRALTAQQEALREEAFDLAWRLSDGLERGRRIARLANTPGHAWNSQRELPPARDVGDETIIAWLSQQGAQLEVIGNELAADRVERDVKQASAPAPARKETVPVREAAPLQVADMGSAGRHVAAPKTR